ncbi:MAG: hypothetical protein WDN00_14935 [Limisphaerales bacterium]
MAAPRPAVLQLPRKKIVVTLDARDISPSPGDQVNKFKEVVASQDYFKSIISKPTVFNSPACRRFKPERTARRLNCSHWNVHYPKYPMKWLPKERRNPLIIVVLITTVLLALIGFGLISSQNATLAKIADNRRTADDKLQQLTGLLKMPPLRPASLPTRPHPFRRPSRTWLLEIYILGHTPPCAVQTAIQGGDSGNRPARNGDVELFPAFPLQANQFQHHGQGVLPRPRKGLWLISKTLFPMRGWST